MKWERADNMGDIIYLYIYINYILYIPILSIFNSYDLGFMYRNVDKFYILFLRWVNRIIMSNFVYSLVLLIIESLSLNRL